MCICSAIPFLLVSDAFWLQQELKESQSSSVRLFGLNLSEAQNAKSFGLRLSSQVCLRSNIGLSQVFKLS